MNDAAVSDASHVRCKTRTTSMVRLEQPKRRAATRTTAPEHRARPRAERESTPTSEGETMNAVKTLGALATVGVLAACSHMPWSDSYSANKSYSGDKTAV